MTPTSDAIHAQLERLSASSVFANSQRLNRFLRFVVERSLAGDSERLKEYLIGVEVFDRDQQYDPRVDSIVRVEAGRLRAKLAEYYRECGAADPVVISLQRGSYAPTFAERISVPPERADTVPPTGQTARPRAIHPRRSLYGVLAFIFFLTLALAWLTQQSSTRGTTIAVLPFIAANPADAPLALQLTMGVSSALVREGSLQVVASGSARNLTEAGNTMREIAQMLDADLLLQGNVRATTSDEARVEVVLIDGDAEHKFWVQSFTGKLEQLDDLEQRIAVAAAAAGIR